MDGLYSRVRVNPIVKCATKDACLLSKKFTTPTPTLLKLNRLTHTHNPRLWWWWWWSSHPGFWPFASILPTMNFANYSFGRTNPPVPIQLRPRYYAITQGSVCERHFRRKFGRKTRFPQRFYIVNNGRWSVATVDSRCFRKAKITKKLLPASGCTWNCSL